ncbi:hypothetical protein HMI48_04440 [Acidithiobacillus ferrooxidans]|uniref:hypothetical protein n=1 Tax=Acidithiobacillus ferrooxidans TaxID=920 RepID=UPI001C07CB28|nr:hypothetical protein [Acidithiobacillus ferrooxidans]MBU2773185.1 hypothetical protein [Acidithiobacillus ferrooxidans]
MRENVRFRGKQIPPWLASLLLLCGMWAFSMPCAAANVEFAFSVGGGVNAYYLPAMADFIYTSDGFDYEWSGDGWLYSGAYYGPWLPLPVTMVVPPALLYGPPPPVFAFRPYFLWWRARVAPWYRRYHPGWWLRHHFYLAHYRIWRTRVIPLYRNRPFYRGRIRPVLRPLGGRIRIIRRVGPPTVRKIIVRRPSRQIIVVHHHPLRQRVIARRER